MPRINPKLLGDWIQIVASLGVLAGIILLVVDLVALQDRTGSKRLVPEVRMSPPAAITEEPMEVTRTRESELRLFVQENCPACHGAALAGSIGPALSGEGLAHLSLEAVSFTILNGYEAKGMPAWNTRLTKPEADWIAAFLKQELNAE